MIDQQGDLDPAMTGRDQSFSDVIHAATGVPDVCFYPDTIGRLLNVTQPLFKDCLGIIQQLHC